MKTTGRPSLDPLSSTWIWPPGPMISLSIMASSTLSMNRPSRSDSLPLQGGAGTFRGSGGWPPTVALSRSATRLVPGLDHRRLAFPAEPRDRRGPEREGSTGLGGESQPPSREHPEHVPVREDEDIAVDGAEALDETIRARRDVL